MPEAALPTGEGGRDAVAFVADALRAAGEGGRSNSDLRRTFGQNGVSLHDQAAGLRHLLTDPKTPIRFAADGDSEPRVVVEDGGVTVRPGAVLQLGRKTFVRCVGG
jgi:hypothetical protein